MSRNNWIALTYNNRSHTDGAGAQLQRVYGIYALAKAIGVPYIHTPLWRLDYQGLGQLRAGFPDTGLVERYNAVYTIASDDNAGTYPNAVEIAAPEPGFHTALLAQAESLGRRTLVRVSYPYGILDRCPGFYEVCRQVSPFRRLAGTPRHEPLRAAIHLRRGDLRFIAPERILRNAYYVSVALEIAGIMEAAGIETQFELHTEVAESEFVVEPGRWSATGLQHEATVTPQDDALEEFDAIPNLVRCYNEPAMVTLEKLATADILLISKSSFSYLAAVLSPAGITVYTPFWHAMMPNWVLASPEGALDSARFKACLVERGWVLR